MAEFPSRWGAGNASKSFNQPNLLELPSHLIDRDLLFAMVSCLEEKKTQWAFMKTMFPPQAID
jgi:hypothetical protein